MATIIKNSVRCHLCNEEIESKHRHDFVWCKCGNIAVDGGKEYFRRVGNGIKVNSTTGVFEPEFDDTSISIEDKF